MGRNERRVRSKIVVAALLAAVSGAAAQDPPAPPKLPRWRDTSGMVFLRGGEFTRDGGFKVRVRSFYMDRHEVTNAEYGAFLNDGQEKRWNGGQEIERREGRFAPKEGKERWPVRSVSWSDASAYATWAGNRLPTEAEWEFAAAGREGRKYPWGNEPITPARANFGGAADHPGPVESHPEGRTPEGLFDLSGNVAEWCLDRFDAGYYGKAPPQDPEGPEKVEPVAGEKAPRRVRRGGCYAMPAPDQEAASRGSSPEDGRSGSIGFRCVRPARRVLLLLGENFEEIEFAAFTGVLSWASHTTRAGNYVVPRDAEREVARIEVVVAGFASEVRGMGGTCVRPHVLVGDLKAGDVDRFDAVAIPACVGGGRGQHTWKGQADLTGKAAIDVVRRVHANGGIIATMCWSQEVLEKAGIPCPKPGQTPPESVVLDREARTLSCWGPGASPETVYLLVRELVGPREYRVFRQYNPWLFGPKDLWPPRVDDLK